MCKHTVKKLPFVTRYVPDRYKTQQMCNKAILENSWTLKSVLDCYKNQQMCDKAVDNYPHALGFIAKCYKISVEIDIRLMKCVIKPLIIFCQQ